MNTPAGSLPGSSAGRVIVAITGASGSILGIRLLEMLREAGIETHLVISAGARLIIARETGRKIEEVTALASFNYDPADLQAGIASGSFVTRGMLIAPCSIKTLSGVANSYADNLIVRTADVCLKEGRPLLLAVRETPLHRGHLRLMDLAARAGAVIYPPIPFFYGAPQNLSEVITQIAGRMLLRIGIENSHYPRWIG
jgi:4-hydroxy-3-polyprenylbenzoate decarboxylase